MPSVYLRLCKILQARAIEASIREQSMMAQVGSESATRHARDEARIADLIPPRVRNVSQEWVFSSQPIAGIKSRAHRGSKKFGLHQTFSLLSIFYLVQALGS